MLKSFFFNIYVLTQNYSLYLILLIFLLSATLLLADIRRKFIVFLFLVILFSVWGFLLDLDGLFLIFLTAEFTIFFLFLMSYAQLYNNYKRMRQSLGVFSLLIFISPIIYYDPANIFYLFISYYKSLNYIVSGDFYIIYHLLFEKLFVITLIIILIISLFSLFFILLYFSFKLVKLFESKKVKQVYFLRKQVLIKQNSIPIKQYTFQN